MWKAQYWRPAKNNTLKFRFEKINIKRVATLFHPFFIFFILLPFSSFSSYNYSPKVKKAYEDFFKLRINPGQKSIQEALAEDPSNGLAILIDNYGEVISVFISEDQKVYSNTKGNEEKRMKQIQSLSKTSPYYLYIQAEIKLQWAFVKLKFGDEMSAVWDVRQAFKLLNENLTKFPNFVDTKKSLGLLNITFGSIPDKYVTLANLAGMKGNIEEGLKQLSEVASSSSPFAIEAQFYKILAENYILKKDPPSLQDIKTLYQEHQDNLLLNFVYSSLLIKNAYSDDALTILKNRPTSADYFSFPYLDFLTAEIFLFKGEYLQAKGYYQKFLNQYHGKNFIKDCYYKLLLTAWLNNEEALAKSYFPKILANGQAVYDGDKYAQKFAEKGELPNKILMKARLYFDGGFYQQALQTINQFTTDNSSISDKDMIEFNYRKGRIFHQLNNYSQASIFYLKTIELSKNLNYYFAPNSALQMGYIYKEQGNKELARVYFNKARSYQDYEYKNSIDSKAKAALQELKK